MSSERRSQGRSPPGSQRCWVCGSADTRAWKTQNVQGEVDPQDLSITDARYGLTLALSECSACGFRFADSSEVERLTALYEALEDEGYEESSDSRLLQMRWLASVARRAHPRGRTALDVGAAAGLLVEEARRQGLEATGVEPSRSLVDVARKDHGIDLLAGTLPHPSLEGRRFDVVFLVDVLEHVADPVGLLQLCRDRLADDGLLVLVTPDARSAAARLLGPRWWHCRIAHVGYFGRPALEIALERAGLVGEHWGRTKWFFSIGYLAERLAVYLPVGWINRLAERLPPLRWLYRRVIPLNLFDSFLVLARPTRAD